MRGLMIVMVAVLVTLGMTGCFDPQPGEISLISVKSGKPVVCGVQVFNAAGKQIQQESSDFNGVVYITKLKPGTYTLKFVDSKKNMYPAVKTCKVRAGDSVVLGEVDVTEAPAEDGVQ